MYLLDKQPIYLPLTDKLFTSYELYLFIYFLAFFLQDKREKSMMEILASQVSQFTMEICFGYG